MSHTSLLAPRSLLFIPHSLPSSVKLRPKRFAGLYTGKMPKDTAVVL